MDKGEWIVDYSQVKLWLRCPWAWWNKYVRGYQKKREGQQRDALTLGTLVHAGLEEYVKSRKPVIPPEVVEEANPTKDCLLLAEQLIGEYVRIHPREEWVLERTEEVLTFPLPVGEEAKEGGVVGGAKLDAYFKVEELSEVESGVSGEVLTLAPGWWAREYKTKDAGLERARWAGMWASNLQADFQLLALKERVGEWPRGVLVSVLEKPRQYVPKRKCKGCGEIVEMGLYHRMESGEYACPLCGERQKLSPYEPKTTITPQFFRLKVERTVERLEWARRYVGEIAEMMWKMKEKGEGVLPNLENCSHPVFGFCEYFNVCHHKVRIEEDETLEKKEAKRYLGGEK